MVSASSSFDEDLDHDFQLQFFRDFKARRAGIVKALTSEVEIFYTLYAHEKGNLCLYGLPDETWEVKSLPMDIPTELPEPISGINIARDGMDKKKWLSLVAMHSNSWLLALTFYYGTCLVSDKDYSR